MSSRAHSELHAVGTLRFTAAATSPSTRATAWSAVCRPARVLGVMGMGMGMVMVMALPMAR